MCDRLDRSSCVNEITTAQPPQVRAPPCQPPERSSVHGPGDGQGLQPMRQNEQRLLEGSSEIQDSGNIHPPVVVIEWCVDDQRHWLEEHLSSQLAGTLLECQVLDRAQGRENARVCFAAEGCAGCRPQSLLCSPSEAPGDSLGRGELHSRKETQHVRLQVPVEDSIEEIHRVLYKLWKFIQYS